MLICLIVLLHPAATDRNIPELAKSVSAAVFNVRIQPAPTSDRNCRGQRLIGGRPYVTAQTVCFENSSSSLKPDRFALILVEDQDLLYIYSSSQLAVRAIGKGSRGGSALTAGMLPPLYYELVLLTGVLADYLVAPRVVNSVNYDEHCENKLGSSAIAGLQTFLKSSLESHNYYTLLCADGIPLLMEDHRPRSCQPRPWLREQKCPTGFWCHEGEHESSHYCCPRNRKVANRCHLPPVTGHGNATLRRFYYSWTDDGCHELTYTGLGGNENSFTSYEQCERACRGAGEPDVILPEDAKIAKNKKVIKTTTTALPSTTTGIFTTREITTTKELKKTTKPVIISSTVLPSTKTTMPSTTTATTHATRKEASSMKELAGTTTSKSTTNAGQEPSLSTPWAGMNPCELPSDKGTSGGVAQKMWYFDAPTLSCQPFTYLGSGGNPNRFLEKDECTHVCGSGLSGKPSSRPCDLPPQFGNGTYKIPRYFYDKVTRSCELFFYSGRGGNENRFLRKNRCEKLCTSRKSKTQSTPEITTTLSTRPATRTFQELHSTQELPEEHFHTIRTSTTARPPVTFTTESPTTTKPAVPASTPVTHAPKFPVVVEPTSTETHPTLISVPKEFVPPFPQFTFSPTQLSTTPAVQFELQKTTSRPSAPVVAPMDKIFEQLMISSGAAVVLTTTAPLPVAVKAVQQFPSHVVFPDPWKPHTTVSETRTPSAALFTVPPYQLPETFQTLTPQHKVHKPESPVVAAAKVSAAKAPVPVYSSVGALSLSTVEQPIVPGAGRADVDQPSSPKTVQHGVYGVQEPTSTQNPEWLQHGMRAFQRVMQQEVTSTVAPCQPSPMPRAETENINEAKEEISADVQGPVPVVALPLEPPLSVVQPASPYANQTVNITDISACRIPIFGKIVIMCELEEVTCPEGTFCQIGDGQSICCPSPSDPVCTQPVLPGVGPSTLLRWYHDVSAKQCLPFLFHGFQSNQNNFETAAACELTCIAPEICKGSLPLPAVSTNGSCSPLYPETCPSGAVCRVSEENGASACCSVPKELFVKIASFPEHIAKNCLMDQDPGYGVESSHRWSFDPVSSKCLSFMYNGYGGNQNNFLTKRDCESTCKQLDRCDEPVASGHGNKYISRFFYSKEYGQCLHFVYSGEGGNSNNFLNLEECMQACVNNVMDFKSHPSSTEATFAFAFVPRPVCPHGEVTTNEGIPVKCDAFTGFGCPAGNVCTTTEIGAYCCQAPERFCLQPRPPLSVCSSPASPPVQRVEFTYDPFADRCVQFTYSSCSPALNLNHFQSSSQCTRLCCNRGYDLVYKKRFLMLSDSPLESARKAKLH